MVNMMKMMKQAQAMQQKMQDQQEALAKEIFEFSAGGGMVTAVATGDGNLKSIKIDPKVVDPDDVEMLEDLVLAAAEGAIAAGKEATDKEMAKLTKGMNIPGMPF